MIIDIHEVQGGQAFCRKVFGVGSDPSQMVRIGQGAAGQTQPAGPGRGLTQRRVGCGGAPAAAPPAPGLRPPRGCFIETTGTAEGAPFDQGELDSMLGLAKPAIEKLFEIQKDALERN